MKINNWPIAERPREKLLILGAQALSHAELIAILLQCGTQGKTAVDIARELLTNFGSLKKLREAPIELVLQTSGIGKAKYALLRAALELGRRCLSESVIVGTTIKNSNDSKLFLTAQLREQTREIFACLFLNTRNQILAFEKLFLGTLAETAVYPREIVKHALAHNAAKVILSHNHPSGDPSPSNADQESTTIIKKALALIDVTVIDHIIIGQQENFSFSDAGWI
jgi:DNA repair protein RadC